MANFAYSYFDAAGREPPSVTFKLHSAAGRHSFNGIHSQGEKPMKIIEIPPEPDEQQLTARAPTESLGDHRELFLLFNNRGAWASEEQYNFSFDLLSDRLIRLGAGRGCYLQSMKRDAGNIRRQFKKLGIRVKVHHIYTALAGALGYSSYKLARNCRTVDDYIDNLWPPGTTLGRELLLGRMPKGGWPSTKLIKWLEPRIAYNMKRREVDKKNAIDLKENRRRQWVREHKKSVYESKQRAEDPALASAIGDLFTDHLPPHE